MTQQKINTRINREVRRISKSHKHNDLTNNVTEKRVNYSIDNEIDMLIAKLKIMLVTYSTNK